MAVQFSSSAQQEIKFSAPTNALGLTSKTIFLNYTPASDTQRTLMYIVPVDQVLDTDEYNRVQHYTGRKLEFVAHFSTMDGIWRTTNACLTLNAENKIMIVYDGASTANNPTIYVNGVSVAVTRTVAPSGTYRSGTSGMAIYIGGIAGLVSAPDGKIKDVRIYSGSKTSGQALSIASEVLESSQNIDETNLKFHASLSMCKDLTYSALYGTPFAGATLGSSNEFYDRINGYVGVPSGSPVGAS